MAKLGPYYGLCPLIDHRSLLGISPDEENGVVIVTLGKNIAIKFKISDQKQLYSWRTKDKFSSPIIYDKEQSQYAAVFSESFVRLWTGNEEFLDKLKKLRFNQQIYTIFLCNEKSFIVFKSGSVSSLKESVQNRKDFSLEKIINLDSEYIIDVLHSNFNDHVYVGLVVQCKEFVFLYWTTFNESNQQSKFCKLRLQRDNTDLRGFLFHVDQISVKLLSLWSDGKIYSAELKEDVTDIGELFTVIESISCKTYVSMISLDPNYIALYGCNSNEEGALLVIYNIQFKVAQTRQSFKLFSNGAKIWCVEEKLFFPVGQNLAVIPFHLDMEQLAALVGSHKVIETNPDSDISVIHKVQFADWGKHSVSLETNIPKLIESKVQEFTSQGLNKNMIFETVLTELLEDKNGKKVETLAAIIQYFSDMPENGLIKILKLILSLESASTAQNLPQKLFLLERAELLDKVLVIPFNETLIVSNIRSVLTLDEVLVLLQYICFLLSEDGHPLPLLSIVETEAKLIEWSCVLLDANYQKILLTRDETLSGILLSLKDHFKEELNCLEDAKLIASLFHEVEKGKSLQKCMRLSVADYFIEDFPLY